MGTYSAISKLWGKFVNSRLFRGLTSSWFIALLLAGPSFFLIDPNPDRYSFKLLGEINISGETYQFGRTYYSDFGPNSGNCRMTLMNQPGKYSSLVVYLAGSSQARGQWNFKGLFDKFSASDFSGDFDQDGLREVYCLTLDGNRIYLNVIEPYSDRPELVVNRFVDTVEARFGAIQGYPECLLVHDLTGDGMGEIVFSYSGGSGRQPRKVYAYDVRNDSLWTSPFSGSTLKYMDIGDIDHDGMVEVFGTTNAPDNYSGISIDYPDDRPWLKIFDARLKYKYEPVTFGDKYSGMIPQVQRSGDSLKLYLYGSGAYEAGTGLVRFEITGFNGRDVLNGPSKLILNKFCGGFRIDSSGYLSINANDQDGEYIHFLRLPGGVKLNEEEAFKPSPMSLYNEAFGIDGFAWAFVINDLPRTFRFYDRLGTYLGGGQLVGMEGEPFACWSGQLNGAKLLNVEGDNLQCLFKVSRNHWHWLRYLLMPGLFLAFLAFIRLIRYIQFRQFSELEARKREVLELQLKGVRNQLDPHFTFNALNVLSGLSMAGDNKGVMEFVNHFSRLLRGHLKTSDKILVSLTEEIDFVVSFVELQRMRFGNSLHLQLDIDRDVDLETPVPKMYIQTHVENAIKHGLRPYLTDPAESGMGVENPPATEGLIILRIRQDERRLLIEVEDNGVGRGHSRATEYERTGTGLMSLGRIRESVLKLYGIRMSQEIEDLRDAKGEPAGTRVRIEVVTRDA